MLELSDEEGWRGTGDPIMAVKLARSVLGDRAPELLQTAMWRLLGELEVQDSQWTGLFELGLEYRPINQMDGRIPVTRSQGKIQARLNEIIRPLDWHESMPFRLLSRAIANDFYRFVNEVNDTHLKAHFCDIIRDILPPGHTATFMEEFARQFPLARDWARRIQATGAWSSLSFLADQWESVPFPEKGGDSGSGEKLLILAIEHARGHGHGPGCWLVRMLVGD